MKRKMIAAAAAYMSGLFFASFFNNGSVFIAVLITAVIFSVAARLIKMKIADAAMISVIFVSAVTVSFLYSQNVYQKVMEYDNTIGDFEGKVTESDYYSGDKARYILDGKINGTQNAEIVYFGEALNAEHGDIMTLKKCSFEAMESDFLYSSEDYYKSKGIFLSVSESEECSIQNCDTDRFIRRIAEYREKMISDFRINLGTESGGMLAGMIFGEKSLIDANGKSLMYRSGIGHILAVSGLHVSIIAVMIMFLLKRLRVGNILSFLIINVFMGAFIVMAESPISALRAGIMLDFIYSAKIFRRQADAFTSLSAAVLILSIPNPMIIHNSGFILSVTATLAVAVTAPYITKNLNRDSRLKKFGIRIIEMTVVMLMILPVSMMYFDEVSLISPVTNVIFVPIFSAAMILGMIYVLTAGTVPLLGFSGILVDIIRLITLKVGNLDFVYISCGSRALRITAVSGLIMVILAGVIIRKRRYIILAVCGAVSVFMMINSIQKYMFDKTFRMTVLGRGTNTAIAISYDGRTDIIDLSGNYHSPDYVRKYLGMNGISYITTLTLTNKSASQYSAYMKQLELTDIGAVFAEEDIGIENPNMIYFDSGNINLNGKGYSFSYSDDVLQVEYNGVKTVFAPLKDERRISGNISVYYGKKSSKNTFRTDGSSFYLADTKGKFFAKKGMNNFEILIDTNGNVTVRRL